MNHTKVLILIIALAALASLAGCRMVEPEPTPDPAEQLAMAEQRFELIGSSWQAEYFGAGEDSLPILPDTKLTLNILLQRYGGYDGCNWFLGVYDVDGDVLRFGTPARTAFLCEDEAISSQAATYSSAVVNITNYEMDGDRLVTYTVGEQPMATFVPAEPVPLEGTEWTAKFVNDGERMTQASTYEFVVTAVFEDGKVRGNGGCNDYEADYEVDGDMITISNLDSGDAECSDTPGANNIEDMYFSALEATSSWSALVVSMAFMDAEGTDQVFFGTP